MGRPKGGRKRDKNSNWVENRKCHCCDLPGHLVGDCSTKKAGKPQKPGFQRQPRQDTRKGDRSARSAENGDDYEETMLGTHCDAGLLEREVHSIEADECMCYRCDCDEDFLFEDDLADTSREVAFHPLGEAGGS